MTRRIKILCSCLLPLLISAQDKLYFTDGSVRTVSVISVNENQVYFRTDSMSGMQKLQKASLLMVELQAGRTYIFEHPAFQNTMEVTGQRNFIGGQPFEIFNGRATVTYEKLLPSERVGIVIPFSLTFLPPFVPIALDSSRLMMIKKVSFITGVDVNFYVGKNRKARFFIGPRVRYGTDVLFLNVTGYTVQTQLGWRLGTDNVTGVHHLCFGFGFARILSSALGPFRYPDRSYGWFSTTYRISFRW